MGIHIGTLLLPVVIIFIGKHHFGSTIKSTRKIYETISLMQDVQQANMKAFLFFAFVVAVATAMPYPEEEHIIEEESIVEDEEGQQYYLLPVERAKRQTDWQIKSPGVATISHTGTILDNPNHHLGGTGYLSKDLRGHGIAPETYGGNLNYVHKPSASNLGLGADHTRGLGTNVHASGTYNFIHSKNADVGVTGQYGRTFGGPGGTSKPDWGVFVGGKIRF